MIVQTGTVVHVDAESAEVLFDRMDGCTACARGQGCGLLSLSGLLGFSRRRSLQLPVDSSAALIQGERVRVGIRTARLIALISAAYIAPLLLLFVGALLGEALFGAEGSDTAALLGGITGVVLAIAGLRLTGLAHLTPAWLGAQIISVR